LNLFVNLMIKRDQRMFIKIKSKNKLNHEGLLRVTQLKGYINPPKKARRTKAYMQKVSKDSKLG